MKLRAKIAFILYSIPAVFAITIAVWISKSAKGLPIDDAYIFRQYAYNLASGFGYSFNPNETSFGCSSFLWTVILAFFLKIRPSIDYFFLVQSLGLVFLFLSLFIALKFIHKKTGSFLLCLISAVFLSGSSLLFMNAISGMETMLFIFLSLLFLNYLEESTRLKNLKLGLCLALLFLSRPEGLYFIVAIILISILTIFDKKNLENQEHKKVKLLDKLKISRVVFWFLVLVLPYSIWVYRETRSLLPATYIAKIYSSDPTLLERDFFLKVFDGLSFLVYGWNVLIAPFKLLGSLILTGFFILFAIELYRALKRKADRSILILLGFCFLPFLYGFQFRIHPFFGGYYNRYIAGVFIGLIICGLVGWDELYKFISKRFQIFSRLKKINYLIAFVVVLVYSFPVIRNEIKDGKRVYINEVALNEGLRAMAGRWISENTPESAKLLVGYTGLGVVGSESRRYVYDIGALINPDILPYFEGTKALSQKRWERVLSYICKQGIDYYVSFAPIQGPDPAQTRGFKEIQRIGTKEDNPQTPYEQIRIYHIELEELCKDN